MEVFQNVGPFLVGVGGATLPLLGYLGHTLMQNQVLREINEITCEDPTPERFSSLTKKHLFKPLLAYAGLNLCGSSTALLAACIVRSQETTVDDVILGLGLGFAIVSGSLIRRLINIRSRVKDLR